MERMAGATYLDYAATAPLRPEVLEVMTQYLKEEFGNPSSPHHWGQRARHALDSARDTLAAVLGCSAREIIFTSGGTEANNLALRGVLGRWRGERGDGLVVSAIEHDSVLESARQLEAAGSCRLTLVPCNRNGQIEPEAVAAAVEGNTALVSVMGVNNETGVIQDVAQICASVRRRNPATLVHCDAVQALGKTEIDVSELGVDLMTVSAHKVGGPKGVGALFARWGVWLDSQISGGGQERSRRSGTENVAGIVGFARAAEIAVATHAAEQERLGKLQQRLEAELSGAFPEIRIAGQAVPRVPNISAFAIPGIATEALLTALDGRGLAVSGGSACSSGALSPAHALLAMGFGDDYGFMRCSTGPETGEQDIAAAIRAISEVLAQAGVSGSRGPELNPAATVA